MYPVDDDVMINNHKFEFVDMSELYVVAQANGDAEYPEYGTGLQYSIRCFNGYYIVLHFNYQYYIFADVMGVVEGYENISKITTRYGLRDIVHFRITDGRYIHFFILQ